MKKQMLRSVLSQFDGKNISILTEIQRNHQQDPAYLADLVTFLSEKTPYLSAGASWILKAEVINAEILSDDLCAKLIKALPDIQDWQTALHLLQLMDKLSLTEAQIIIIIQWAQIYQQHQRPFLRAWSLHIIVQLGCQIPDLLPKNDLVDAINAAGQDPAASVRARARQLQKLITE